MAGLVKGDAAAISKPPAITATVCDLVADLLVEREVVAVFELTGGMITRLLDAIHRLGRTRIVSMHHEQGAGFAAEGAGRMTGRASFAMGTSGPGATNLLTAVGDCYFDSVPAVFVTGQVNRIERRGEPGVRQFGFQEADIVSMAAPVTKWAYGVSDPDDVIPVLRRAFDLAESGPPGPVLRDIPMDVHNAKVAVPMPVPVAARLPMASTLWGYSAPSFAAVAEAYGIPSRRIAEPGEAGKALQWLNSARSGPALLEVAVDTFTKSYPKIAFGSPITSNG